jgi:hypothetical protein
MPEKYPDTWHDCEAADERAWPDNWTRNRAALHYGVMNDRKVGAEENLAAWPRRSLRRNTGWDPSG